MICTSIGFYSGYRLKDFTDRRIRKYYQRGRMDESKGHKSALAIVEDAEREHDEEPIAALGPRDEPTRSGKNIRPTGTDRE